MKIYQIDEQFILELYDCIGCSMKKKTEEKFPEIFKKRDLVIYEYFPTGRCENQARDRIEYYFAIGDKIQICDGSYHLNADGSKINESLGLTRPKGTIIFTKSKEFYQGCLGKASLNLLIKLDDGRFILSAPNCVEKI